MIPEETIAEIKRRADIASVVGRTVKLKRVGRNLVGLCPFHSEKSPSFNVKPDEGFFYCFGCKAAGDVVGFLERTTGQSFLDVVTQLAAETGVEIPRDDMDPAEAQRRNDRKQLLRVVDLAQVFFRTRLTGEQGAAARAYLRDVRKVDDDTVERFGLGFGGVSDHGLVQFLQDQHVSVDDAVRAGVLGRSERGPYDFYRHRITFPIRGARGEILAFGGRIFGDNSAGRPKYVNGPQTPLYDKSRVLYGLFEAQPALKQGKPAVIVEGYLDVIAIQRAGLATGVAPCGTSFTPGHCEELVKRTERVLVCMDQDRAGQEGSARAMLMLLSAGLDVGLVTLPEKDPDTLVQAGRVDELRTLLLGAPSALDALLARARASSGSVHARVQALDALLPFLAAPPRELVRNEGIRTVAKAFSEDEGVLAAEVDKRGRAMLQAKLRTGRVDPPGTRAGAGSTSSRPPPRAEPPQPRMLNAPGERTAPAREHEREPASVTSLVRQPKRTIAQPFTVAERDLTVALLCHPALAPRCGVLVDVLRNRELRGFIERLTDALVRLHDKPPHEVLRHVPIAPRGQVATVLHEVQLKGGLAGTSAFLSEETAARIIEDTLVTLDKRVIEARLGDVQAAIAAADTAGDHGERKRLLTEQQGLVRALQGLAIREAPPKLAAAYVPVALVEPGPPMAPQAPAEPDVVDVPYATFDDDPFDD